MKLDPDSFIGDLRRALAGRYLLERALGKGGMGMVYLARELRLDRTVAIKALPPARAAQQVARERFLSEARTAARLSHPSIVPIFAVDEVDGFCFYAMPYVPGETLGQRVRGAGPLPPADVVRLLREVAAALAYAHAEGVVHRDIKPDNILLEAASGRALLSDFGIARVGSGSGTTGPREVVGTAEFMSPEQASGDAVDARSDLYSLGVVGFYALSGRLPFAAADGFAMLAQHVTEPPPPLAAVVPDVPRRLAQAIDQCLAKDPRDRFPTGAALAAALTLALPESGPAPIAIRAFLAESRHLSLPALLYGAFALLAVPLLALQALVPAEPAQRLVAAGFAAWIVGLPLALALARVRRLVRAGHAREDLTEALAAELARRREELVFLYGHGRSRFESALRGTCYAALAATAAAVGLGGLAPDLVSGARLWAAGGVGAAVALLTGVLARARTEHRTDPKAERRLRLWRGPIGRWLFRVAAHGVERKRKPATAA